MLLFRYAVSVVNDREQPYRLNLAIPVDGKFELYEYKFRSRYDCLVTSSHYLDQYLKDPDSILKFHQDLVLVHESCLQFDFLKKK